MLTVDWLEYTPPPNPLATLFSTTDDYILIWAQRSVGLEVTMRRTSDHVELWKARHQGIRAEGGLPLSPVSMAVSSFNAARFYSDDDVTPSLIDDVVRRLVASLPDTR